MKKANRRRVIILSDLNSGYFEQAVFYIKAGTENKEDILICEANKIVEEFSKKYQSGTKNTKKSTALKKCAAVFGIFILCAIILCIIQ